jgi:WXG100 family type VII secretion target
MKLIGNVQLKVTPEVLNEKAEAVSKSITTMERCYEEMETILKRTNTYWSGDAADKHRKMYEEQKESINQMMQRLKEHPADLQTMSQTYSTVEREVADVANALAGDVIE